MAATPLLEAHGLCRRFGGVAAVDTVDFEVRAGEFFSLLGPSGCGKTTLLRLIAGFEHPDAGTLCLDGEDLTHLPPYARPVNLMFQSYALFPHLDVRANIAFGLRQARLGRAATAARIKEMLALVQLETLSDRRPHQLSGGQQQRVALARALARHPRILLLDEPLAALDRKLREQTRLELVRIQERVGITFIMVTHDQEEAMTMSSRLAVMKDGRIVQTGPPEQVYEHPANRAVAGFLGAVNLLPARVAGGGGGRLRLTSGALEFEVATDPAGYAPGSEVWVALRPEKIRLASDPSPTAVNAARGEIVDRAYLGNLSIYHVRLDAGMVLEVQHTNAERAGAPFATGDRVALSWPAQAAVVLSP